MSSKLQALNLGLLFLALTQARAAAEDIAFEETIRLTDLEQQTLPGDDPNAVEFVANLKEPLLGRAWVTLHYPTMVSKDDSGPSVSSRRIVVPGLTYDATENEIDFTAKSGDRTICATKVQSSFWRSLQYESAPNCELTMKYEMTNLDDGFYRHRELAAKVTIKIKKP